MSTLLTAGLERALNRYLAQDPDSARRLAALDGRVIALSLRGLELDLYFLPGREDVQVLQHYAGEPDVLIRGTPLALARLATTERRGEGLFGGEVELSGDSAAAQGFQDLLQKVDIDWEEQLAGVVGDYLAHQTGRLVRAGREQGARLTRTLEQDLGEYLTEEARLLPSRAELELFYTDIDILRDDTERLAARLQRLERHLEEQDQGE